MTLEDFSQIFTQSNDPCSGLLTTLPVTLYVRVNHARVMDGKRRSYKLYKTGDSIFTDAVESKYIVPHGTGPPGLSFVLVTK